MSDQDPHPLVDYLYGELSEAEARDVEQAVEASPDLRMALEGHVETLGLLRKEDLSEAPPPGLARLALGEADRRPKPLFRRLRYAWLGPTGGLAVAGGLVMLMVAAPDRFGPFGRMEVTASAPPAALSESAAREDEASGSGGAWSPESDATDAPRAAPASPALSPPAPASSPPPPRARAGRDGNLLPKAKKRSRPSRGSRRASLPPPVRTGPGAASGGAPASVRPGPAVREDAELVFEAPVDLALAAEPPRAEEAFDPSADRAAAELESESQGQLAGFVGGAEDEERADPNAGRQEAAARTLVQAAVQARAQGHLEEARSALEAAAARAYRLPLLGDILLLRAEIELEDQRYTEARTFAARAARVEDFAEKARAKALEQRARVFEAQNRN